MTRTRSPGVRIFRAIMFGGFWSGFCGAIFGGVRAVLELGPDDLIAVASLISNCAVAGCVVGMFLGGCVQAMVE